MTSSRALLENLFRDAVAAVHPAACLPVALPPPPVGRLILLAAGKAAGSMIEVAERHYLETGLASERLTGLGVTRHGYGRPTQLIPVIEAGHPIPDEAGLKAAEETLRLAQMVGEKDLVVVLLSGGASANWIAPAQGISLAEKQAVTRALLRCGASIGEINTVRKHLSRIKGGRLATAATPAHVVTLAISDVPGDDPAVIGSGPTVADPTTLADARAVVERYRLDLPTSVKRALADPANESPKPGDPRLASSSFRLVARPADAFVTVRQRVRELGYECVFLGDSLEGDAAQTGAEHARLAREAREQNRRVVLLSGGELTVTVRGSGRGGPNQEYALALARGIKGISGISALAADTDGSDGGTGQPGDPAGAFVDHTTLARAGALGLDPAVFLDNNDSGTFFERIGDLLRTGPTYTNVNDFRAILVDSQ
jgi:hydroxypyruvate reductase